MYHAIAQIRKEVLIARQKTLANLNSTVELSAEERLKLIRLNEKRSEDEKKLIEIKKKLEKMNILGINSNDLTDNIDLNAQGAELALITLVRQKVELLRADTLVELASELLVEGVSVVIFVCFRQTLSYITSKLATWNPCRIWGGQTIEERSEQINRFQTNKSKLIISTIQSGGVGVSLHDLDGNHRRVSLVCPTWSAQDLVQALGRIHRAGGKSPCLQYIVYCSGTIEEKMCERVREKITNISGINDGDLQNHFIEL